MAEDGPAEVGEFMRALVRIRREAELLGKEAQVAIERRSFDPYRLFRFKVEEHESLLAVVRSRLTGHRNERGVQETLLREERLRFELLVQSSLRFFYALSASPILPIGARETFIDELESLTLTRRKLEAPEHANLLSAGTLDDLDTARLILEEITEKAPRLLDFTRPRAERTR